MRKLSITAWAVAAMVLAFASGPTVALAADATNVVCGQWITQDTTLEADLYCDDGHGLTIGADGVTLDLGGHTLRGERVTTWPRSGVEVEYGKSRVTIKNGTIENFTLGVRAESAHDLRLTNLVFKDEEPDGSFSAAVEVLLSSKVVIENSSFLGSIPTSWDGPAAITLGGVDEVKVHNVDVHGYLYGVLLGPGDWTTGERPTNGEVTDSTFTENGVSILVATSTHMKVTGNHVSHCTPLSTQQSNLTCIGIEAGWGGPLPTTGVTIKHNFVHNTVEGIAFGSVLDSQVIGNHVINNRHGIALWNGSTGNSIKSNITFGNSVFDLFHSFDSSPNRWVGNSCEIKEGADIPDC